MVYRDDWNEVEIGELGEIITGQTPKTSISENYGGNLMFLTPSDDMDKRYVTDTNRKLTQLGAKSVKNKIIPPNSICVSCIGSQLGKVVITTEQTVTNQQINTIIPNDKTDYMYLYYAMKIVGKRLNHLSKTSTAVPIINKTVFSSEKILLPPLKEQIAIAKLLSSLDDKIENNKAIIANLEAQAQAIFNSWFVNFEPFQDGGFVESELGLIPEGWEVRRIGKETDLFTGFPFKSKTYVDEGEFVVITIKNITDGSLVLDSVNYIEEKPANLPSEANLKIGDIVFTMTGNVGRVALVNQDKLLQNQRIGKLILTQEEHRAFYYFLLRNENYKSKIINLAHGTAQANLGKVDFGNILIPFNYEVIDDFSKITEAFLKQIVLLNNQNQKLAQIRDTLLPKLMSGEIRVGQDEVEEIENPL